MVRSNSRPLTAYISTLLLLAAGGAGCPLPGGVGSYGDDDDSASTDGLGCVEHTSCDSDEYCDAEECRPIFGHAFEFILWNAEVEALDGDGESWDLTGAPDPFALVLVGGVERLETAVADDTFEPSWAESGEVVLTQEDLCFEVWDEDIAADDLMDAGCFLTPQTIVDLVREGEYVGYLADDLVFLDVEVLPVP